MKLDIGCGSRKQGDVGIDIDSKSDADVIADAHYIPFREESFDDVNASAVLEHVIDPDKVLCEVSRICKNYAHLKILVPASSRMLTNFLFYIVTFQAKEAYHVYICNKTSEHKWQFSVGALVNLLKSRGFQTLTVESKPPIYYGDIQNNPFLRLLQLIHHKYPIYKPHIVVEGIKITH